jgi:hypothetical protein
MTVNGRVLCVGQRYVAGSRDSAAHRRVSCRGEIFRDIDERGLGAVLLVPRLEEGEQVANIEFVIAARGALPTSK